MTMDIFNRWGITDLKFRDYIYRMIQFHGRVKMNRNVTESAIRRLDINVGQDIIFDLIDFCKCDITTKFDAKRIKIQTSLDTIKKRIIEIRKKDDDAKWRSPITGYVIMELLGNVAGPVIGKIKKIVDPKIKSGKWSKKVAIDYIIDNYQL